MPPSKRKNPADRWMPPRVYRGKSAYEYHPPAGGAIRLCPLDATEDEVCQAYREAKEGPENTYQALSNGYFASHLFSDLKVSTRRDYEACSSRLNEAFGKMEASKIQPKHVRQFMDYRGKESKVRANRELSLMHNVMAWGYERGKIDQNPCIGIKRFKERSRDRYVTDEEYQAVYAVAPPNVRAAMEIAYLCAARQRDILDLKLQDIRSEGLFICQGKTGKKQIKAWTPRLRAAVELARRQPSRISTIYVIHTRDGQPYTSSGFKAIWKRYKDKAGMDYTFHDLKAKGISDYEGDKRKFSGHATVAMMEKYNLKPEIVDSHDPER